MLLQYRAEMSHQTNMCSCQPFCFDLHQQSITTSFVSPPLHFGSLEEKKATILHTDRHAYLLNSYIGSYVYGSQFELKQKNKSIGIEMYEKTVLCLNESIFERIRRTEFDFGLRMFMIPFPCEKQRFRFPCLNLIVKYIDNSLLACRSR